MTPETTPSSDVATRTLMYREALNEALHEELARDVRVFIMGEGIARRGGSYKVTVGLLDEFGPQRVIDTPISEASFVGMGVGAAITGMRPVVEILFIDFTTQISRLDAVGNEGDILIGDAVTIKQNFGFGSDVLAASLKTQNHVLACLRAGVDIATIPESLFFQMYRHPLTDTGLAQFAKDRESVPN